VFSWLIQLWRLDYTPRSAVRVLVEMWEPYKGRVYRFAGMFVQSEKFVESHGGRIAIYGQESSYTTWNFAWLQHILWLLAPNCTAGVVLANGSRDL
jgi:type I restriction-modification system DNA methylase subunit